MKQVQTDKYNVAWFKLADCIARGEKERALGVYRLLSHSLEDQALATQLHGDILLSFNDESAKTVYKKAAQMYKDNDRFLQAAAVYEHLSTIEPKNIEYRTAMIELYQQLAIASKVAEYAMALVRMLLESDDWKTASELANSYDSVSDYSFTARIHELVMFYMLSTKEVPSDLIMAHARCAVDAWQEGNDLQAIETMIGKIQAMNKEIAQAVREYVG